MFHTVAHSSGCKLFTSKILATFISPRTFSSQSAWDVWKLNQETLQLKEAILQEWEAAKIDILIAPGFGIPAPLIGYSAWLQIASSYTCAMNLLDFPAGSMPVKIVPSLLSTIYFHKKKISKITSENSDDQNSLEALYPRIGDANDIVYKWVKLSTRGAEKIPLNVQVIGRPWQEELVIAAMKQIQSALNKH